MDDDCHAPIETSVYLCACSSTAVRTFIVSALTLRANTISTASDLQQSNLSQYFHQSAYCYYRGNHFLRFTTKKIIFCENRHRAARRAKSTAHQKYL